MKEKKTHKIETNDIVKIYKLLRFNFSVAQISSFFNVNHATIYRIIEKNGCPEKMTIEQVLDLQIDDE